MRALPLLYLCASTTVVWLLFKSISKQRIYIYFPLSHTPGAGVNISQLEYFESSKTEMMTEVVENTSQNKTAYNKTNLYVISLQDVPGADPHNADRRDQFQRDWAALCGPEFTFQDCPGILDERRGFGITRSFVKCFERAISDGAANPIFLEDDARLFNSDFCRGVDWTGLPSDAFVALLGKRQ